MIASIEGLDEIFEIDLNDIFGITKKAMEIRQCLIILSSELPMFRNYCLRLTSLLKYIFE